MSTDMPVDMTTVDETSTGQLNSQHGRESQVLLNVGMFVYRHGVGREDDTCTQGYPRSCSNNVLLEEMHITLT